MDALYSDPELVSIYDVINAGRADFDFYLARLPDQQCRILDVGCGTGRFSVELARLGHDVTGLEPAAEMLAYARKRRNAEQVSWRLGDISKLSEADVFDRIFMTGHAFQCLLSDGEIAAFLAASVAHLSEQGHVLFESRNPTAEAWRCWQPEFAAAPFSLAGGEQVQVTHEVIKVDGEYVTFQERYSFAPSGVSKHSETTLRFAPHDTVVSLAEAVGLKLANVWGDWDGAAFDAVSSPEMIFAFERA